MPKRPPQAWFNRVVQRLGRDKRIRDPLAVAGWLWYQGMTPESRRRVLASENPRVSSRFVNDAIRMFERFHGRSPKRGDTVTIPDPPQVAALLGEIVQINYRARKHDDEKETEYYHRFEHPRPILLTDAKGRRLYIAGGRFKITEAGIEG